VRLAAAYEHLDDPGKAAAVLRQALAAEPPGAPARLPLLCRLADVLLAADAARAAAEVECEAERGDGAEPSPARAREGAAARLAARALDPAASAPHLDSPELAAPPPRLGARSLSVMRIDVLAVQALRDEELGEASTGTALAEIAATAPREARYLRYREEALRRSLLRIFAAPPRSTERQQFRLAALRDAAGVICRGGALSPTPFLSAVWLLEEEEEVKGGAVPVGGQEVGGALPVGGGIQVGAEATIGQGRRDDAAWATENFARRLMHQHPNEPTARALLAIMLRRRTLSAHRLVPSARRRALERLLADAMADGGVDCASGWKALAELQYENRRYAAAAETARAALEWLQRRRARGHEALTQAALGLRLVLAKALRRLGRLDEAERDFRALAGWTTEGEAGFGHMCGSAPTSVHQHALRGLALVALGRGDAPAARSQYERILGKAALGRGPAEHWAHADYGWLLREAGDLQGARAHLERAVEVAEAEGCAVTDSQAGEHRYRLGEVYWALRGRYRAEKQFAYAQVRAAVLLRGRAPPGHLVCLVICEMCLRRRGSPASASLSPPAPPPSLPRSSWRPRASRATHRRPRSPRSAATLHASRGAAIRRSAASSVRSRSTRRSTSQVRAGKVSRSAWGRRTRRGALRRAAPCPPRPRARLGQLGVLWAREPRRSARPVLPCLLLAFQHPSNDYSPHDTVPI
jgi:tetratricopeptide (TPR) repeat protein